MKMSNKILLAVGIIFFATALYFIFFRTNSTLNKKQIDFAVEDTSSIEKIFIKNGNDTLTLIKKRGFWKLNGTFEADNDKIKQMLKVVHIWEIKAKIPANVSDLINKKLDNATIIKIYNKKGVKTIFLGDQTADKSANYARIGNYEPYLLFIPSLNTDLRKFFSTKTDYWRTKSVFRYNPENISEISVTYPSNKKNSFTLKMNKDSVKLFDWTGERIYNINIENIRFFVLHFKNVKFFDFTNLPADSLSDKTPDFIFEVTDNNNYTTELKGYIIIKNKQQDTDKFLALINGNETVFCKYYDFDLILKDLSYFIKKD